MSSEYEDIIGLPHHTSYTRPRMPLSDRAAQFAPFAALTGYDDAIRETGRLTQERLELEEDARAQLDRQQRYLLDRICQQPRVTVTCFVPDGKKQGGAYVTVRGNLKRIDLRARAMVLTDGRRIPLDDILSLQSPDLPEEL